MLLVSIYEQCILCYDMSSEYFWAEFSKVETQSHSAQLVESIKEISGVSHLQVCS